MTQDELPRLGSAARAAAGTARSSALFRSLGFAGQLRLLGVGLRLRRHVLHPRRRFPAARRTAWRTIWSTRCSICRGQRDEPPAGPRRPSERRHRLCYGWPIISTALNSSPKTSASCCAWRSRRGSRPRACEKERGIIAQEIRMYEDSADSRAYEDLSGAMFAHHPHPRS